MNKLDIPITPDAITPDWLTEALRSTGTIQKTAVKSLHIEPLKAGSGMIGQLVRCRLDYTIPEDNIPSSLIAKLSSANPELRTALHQEKFYEKELRFYQELAAQAQLPTPDSYYADIDLETGLSILLLEDLSHLRPIDIPTGCNLAEAELVMRHLAQFHAQWWQSPQLQAKAYLTPYDDRAESRQAAYLEWWPQFGQKIATLLPDYQLSPAFLDLGQRYGSNVAKISTRLSQPPITLIHQDMHVENLLFGLKDDDKPLVFVDWQFCGYGRGVTDVAHFIIYSLPSDLRRRAESSLLQTYHRLLIKYGVQDYDFEQCWTDYQQAFFRNLYGLTAAVSLFDMSRPHAQAFVEAGLSRLQTFSTDHDVSRFL